MKNRFEDSFFIEVLKNLFDYIRIIDICTQDICYEFKFKTCQFMTHENASRKMLHNKCIEKSRTVSEIIEINGRSLSLSVMPIHIDDELFILEGVTDITDRISEDGRDIILKKEYMNHFTDELTRLYNVRFIKEIMPFDISACIKKKIPLSVILIDIDLFQKINDSFGHIAGDIILSEFAALLRSVINEDNVWLARSGGDEFLLCMECTDNILAKSMAERIRSATEEKTFLYNNTKIKITCSLGVYTIDEFDRFPFYEDIIKSAGTSLNKAKETGKNKVC